MGWSSCVVPEDGGGVEAEGGADGGGAACDGNEEGGEDDDGEQDGDEPRGGDGGGGCSGERGAGGEDARAEQVGEGGAEEVAEDAAEDGEQAGLGVEEQGDGGFAGAERAHEADLAAALEDGGGHGGGDGEAGGEQGGGGDEPHEAGDAGEDGAFGLLDAADLLGVGAGDGFADLVGDGVGVGAAVPDLVLLGGRGCRGRRRAKASSGLVRAEISTREIGIWRRLQRSAAEQSAKRHRDIVVRLVAVLERCRQPARSVQS